MTDEQYNSLSQKEKDELNPDEVYENFREFWNYEDPMSWMFQEEVSKQEGSEVLEEHTWG